MGGAVFMAKANQKQKTRRRSRSTRRRSHKKPGFFTSRTVEKSVRVATTANALFQLGEPVAMAVAPHIAAGDMAGAVAAARPAIREAVRARNLVEAFGPMVAGEAGIALKRKLGRIARG